MKLFFTSFLFLFIFQFSIAQNNIKIKGKVIDTQQNDLIGVSLVLINPIDSSTITFNISNEKGQFELSYPKEKNGILIISYVGYQSQSIYLSIQKDSFLNPIVLQVQELETIEVIGKQLPMQLNGDTLIFNTSAFSVSSQDDMQELLKKLPGLVIEQGKVTYNGVPVTEILVDGKKFYGDNLIKTLEALPADIVDQIQIIDKKDVDKETIIQEEKTINLTIKKEAKTKITGFVNGGYGMPNHRYKFNLKPTFIKDKLRTSLNFISDNISTYIHKKEPSGKWSYLYLPGNPLKNDIITTLNYYPTKKTDLNFYYNYTNCSYLIEENSFFESLIRNNYFSRSTFNRESFSYIKHLIHIDIIHKIDTFQSIQVITSFNKHEINIKNFSNSETSSIQPIQIFQDSLHQNRQTYEYNINLKYNRIFTKPNRDLNIEFKWKEYNFYKNNFYESIYMDSINDITDHYDSLLQNQNLDKKNLEGYSKINFSEKWNKVHSFTTFISSNLIKQNQDIIINDQNDQELSDLSTVNKWNEWMNKLFLNYKFEHHFHFISFSFTNNLYHLSNTITGIVDSLSRTYYTPSFSYRHQLTLKNKKKLSFNYSNYYILPRTNQLITIFNNVNTLNFQAGNMNLVPSFVHKVKSSFSFTKPQKAYSLSANIIGDIILNPIISSQTIDEQYRTIFKPINSKYATSSVRFELFLNQKIEKYHFTYNIRFLSNFSNNTLFINNNYSFIQFFENSLILKGTYDLAEKFKLSIYANLKTSQFDGEQNNLTQVLFSQKYSSNIKYTFLEKWSISSNFWINIFKQLPDNKLIYNPDCSIHLNRSLKKDERITFKLSAHNIFNTNNIYQSIANDNSSITTTQSNQIGRYFKLGLHIRF